MFVQAESAVPQGLSALPVSVEVHRGQGLPGVTLVGLARGAAKEALVRVRSALQAIGVLLGSLKLTVSLLPAELPKEGSALDLALAAALLAVCGRVAPGALHGRRFYGALSLAGEVQPVGGSVTVALLAGQQRDQALYVAVGDAPEARLAGVANVVATQSLAHLLRHLRGEPAVCSLPAPGWRAADGSSVRGGGATRPGCPSDPGGPNDASGPSSPNDWSGASGPSDLHDPNDPDEANDKDAPWARQAQAVDACSLAAPPEVPCVSQVIGQALAKQGLLVAAAGGHNVLLMGPPGSGKSMLAQSLPGLLPTLSRAQALMALRIQSACGHSLRAAALPSTPPFRAPHHSASLAALLGGGAQPVPGEVTLAHDGVLFLDELPQFGRRVLESLRGPLEDGSVLIARQQGRMRYPARCQVVAAMNPCPCGFWRPSSSDPAPATSRLCLCAFQALARYRAQLSGPLLDRLDVRVFVDEVPLRALGAQGGCEQATEPHGQAATSAQLREQVERARALQNARQGETLNAWLPARLLGEVVPLVGEVLAELTQAQQRWQLSLRGVARLRKVARTLADLRGAAAVAAQDVQLAAHLRGPW